MNVLLLGGTGAMGMYLSRRLAKSGWMVYVTTRSNRAPTSSEGEGNRVFFLMGNAKDRPFLESALARVRPDAIVDFMTYSTIEFLDRRDFLLRHCGHYLFLSTYRVFAETVPITESSPRLLDVCTDAEYLATDEYAMTKARQENLLRDATSHNWTIIRPAITFSRNRFQFGCLEAWEVCFRSLAGLPVMMPAEMMDKQATLSWADDVARMMERLVLDRRAMAEDFNVATAEHMTWRQISEIYRKEIGMEVRECSLSDYIGVIGSRYQVMYDRMVDRVVDNRKVLSETGLSQKDLTPVSEALSRELSAFKQNPSYPVFLVSRLAKIDKILGTRIPLIGLSPNQKLEYLMVLHPLLNNRYFKRAAHIARRIVRVSESQKKR